MGIEVNEKESSHTTSSEEKLKVKRYRIWDPVASSNGCEGCRNPEGMICSMYPDV